MRSSHLPIRHAGIALVVVLWVLALMSIIAASMVYATRTEILIAGNLVSVARAEALADAGVARAIMELGRPASGDPEQWKPDGITRLWRYNEANIAVTLVDESGKVDINSASLALLVGLFASSGSPDPDSLADAVQDWRDGDDLRRVRGAEKGDYLAAGKDYGPANAPFETIEELRQVLGMTEELFRRIESGITVYSYQAGINTSIAPRTALLAMPGATAEQVDAYIQQRQPLVAQGLPAPPFQDAQGIPASAPTSTFSILISVVLDDNTQFVREAVVRSPGSVSEAPAILAWRMPPIAPDSIAATIAQQN